MGPGGAGDVQRINEIVNGKRGITAETAWLFSNALQDERRRRTEEDQRREVERLEQQEQQNFEKIMAEINVGKSQTGSR